MKIHTLGTSAGTQPFSGFHHSSLAVEADGALYWIDAGECGAYTAHLKGIDILKTRAIHLLKLPFFGKGLQKRERTHI